MKRKWLSFLLAAAMVVLLAGCGEQDKKSAENKKSTDSDYTQSDKSNMGSATDSQEKEQDTASETNEKTKIDNTVSGTQTPGMNAGGYISRGAHARSWEQMVDNGTVRDADGYLLDGENSSW